MPFKNATGKHLYFVTDGERVKIGRANNVYQRVRSLQSGNPKQIWLTDTFRDLGYKELELHRKLENFRIRGEWFWLNEMSKEILQQFRNDHPQTIDID